MNANKILKSEIENNQNVLLVGPPGCGKTARINQVVQEIGKTMFVVRASVSERIDVTGAFIPDQQSGFTKVLPIEWYKRSHDLRDKAVVFLDDLGQAPTEVQASLMMVWDELVPRGVTIVGATNRINDQAGVFGILSPLITRFDAVYRIAVGSDSSLNTSNIPSLSSEREELEAWIAWANSVDAAPEIVAFHRATNGVWLYQFKPTQDPEQRYPDYRAWGSLIKRWKLGLISDVHINATLGLKCATAFKSFIEESVKIPTIDKLFEDPSQFENIKKLSQKFLVAEIAARACEQNIKGYCNLMIKFIEAGQTALAGYSVNSVITRRPALLANPIFKEFIKNNIKTITL
jgi:DNA polymerase III delta prime subunit